MKIKQTPRISQAGRATISLIVGFYLTFSQSHGAEVGLLALGIFGLGFAILNGLTSIIFQKGAAAIENVPLTMVALLIGIFALLAPDAVFGATQSDALAFKMLVTGWATVAAAFELYQARRARFKTGAGRDLLINACFGLMLALLFLLAPLDIVSQVGFFGAYLLISGVHTGIAATSPATSRTDTASSSTKV